MSLLWRSRKQRIGICADRIYLSKHRFVPVAPSSDAAEWRAATDALPGVLKGLAGYEVSLVVADSFVRYALLPWSAAVKSDGQWAAIARHRFATVHGAAAAAQWRVHVTPTAPEGPRLACAVDTALIEALAAQCAASGANLVSAQPFLVAGFNRIRSKVGGGSCWVVVEEPGRLTLAFIRAGHWVAIRSRRSDARWRGMLPEIIERESAFLALAEPCTSVIVCAQDAFDTEQYDAWTTRAMSYRELALAWE